MDPAKVSALLAQGLAVGSGLLGLVPLWPKIAIVGLSLFLLSAAGLALSKRSWRKPPVRQEGILCAAALLILLVGAIGAFTSKNVQLGVGGVLVSVLLVCSAVTPSAPLAQRASTYLLASATVSCLAMELGAICGMSGLPTGKMVPYTLLTSAGLLATALYAPGNPQRQNAQTPCRTAQRLRWAALGCMLLLLTLLIANGALWVLTLLPLAFLPGLLQAVRRIPWTIGRLSIWVLIALLWLFQLSYVTHIADNYFIQRALPTHQLPLLTKNGRPYTHNPQRKEYQSGYQTWLYVCPEELRNEWNKRSAHPYDSVENTLIRYLTSLGHRKDSVGMSLLTSEDIAAVERGIYNANLRSRGWAYRTVWHECEALEAYLQRGETRTPLVRTLAATQWAHAHLTARGHGLREARENVSSGLGAWQLSYALGLWVTPLLWLAFLLLGVAALRRGKRQSLGLLVAWLVGLLTGCAALSLGYWLFAAAALGLVWGVERNAEHQG